jgi:hypothetical protein
LVDERFVADGEHGFGNQELKVPSSPASRVVTMTFFFIPASSKPLDELPPEEGSFIRM